MWQEGIAIGVEAFPAGMYAYEDAPALCDFETIHHLNNFAHNIQANFEHVQVTVRY